MSDDFWDVVGSEADTRTFVCHRFLGIYGECLAVLSNDLDIQSEAKCQHCNRHFVICTCSRGSHLGTCVHVEALNRSCPRVA